MAVQRFCLLLVVLCVTGGQSETSDDSFCSQMTQMKMDIRKLTEDNQKLRTKIEAGNAIMLYSIINVYVSIPKYILIQLHISLNLHEKQVGVVC